MAALAVAIIGAPLTMSFLALETTGDFPLGLVMLAVASIVSIIVRRDLRLFLRDLAHCICAANRFAALRTSAGCAI